MNTTANHISTDILNAIDAGHTTQKQLMGHFGMPKTTLINHLAKLIDAGDVIRTANAQGRVTYTCRPMMCARDCGQGFQTLDALVAHQDTCGTAAPARAPRVNQATIITDFLFANIGTSFTPHQISKATGHKGLRDACARLAAAGKIARTSDAPATYAFDHALLG